METPKKQEAKPEKREVKISSKKDFLPKVKMKEDFSAYKINKKSDDVYFIPFWKHKIFYILLFIFISGLAFIYWSINRPETTVVNNNPVVNEKQESSASLLFYQGDIYTKSNDDNSWQDLHSSINLYNGDSIKTMGDSWAVIQFKNGSLARLDANSEVKIKTAKKEEIILEQIDGQVFHYADKENKILSYKVIIDNVEITALTNMFNTFNNRQSLTAQVFEGALQIVANNTDELIGANQSVNYNFITEELSQNKIAQNENKDETTENEDNELFNYDWLNWNNQQNKLQNLALLNLPMHENWPETINLEGEILENGSIELTWNYEDSYEGEAPYGLYILIGDEEDPSYPKNQYSYVENNITEQKLTWENLEDGEYHFRAGIYDGEKDIVKYSNDVEIKLPAESTGKITLSGNINENNTAAFSWTTEDTITEDGWKLLIAENESPSYPKNTSNTIDLDSDSYTWNNLAADKSYKFRLCEYIAEDDKCRSYSNTISLSTETEEEAKDDNTTTNNSEITVTANLNSNNNIVISWSNLSENERYLLSINRAFGETENIEILASQSQYIFSNQIEGKTYFISMCKINSSQTCLQRSNEVKVSIPNE